jgi:hypothetical protein
MRAATLCRRARHAPGISALMTRFQSVAFRGGRHTIANESVERQVRSALIWQALCGLRGGLKHDDGEDSTPKAPGPAHHDSITVSGLLLSADRTRRQPALWLSGSARRNTPNSGVPAAEQVARLCSQAITWFQLGERLGAPPDGREQRRSV